ncbi:hypothetical protein RN001_015595 [Aquatica leii]|uniref:SWIM-type domain-containing protein n=1 Tax=Aquatica leii TaxID=1421715 RepID=A0AAN7S5R0_9COLE|nr:hypothetical protein RN001_015595 [Aquatica leii]
MECRFSVCDYFLYIKGTENSKVVYEGEEVLNAGHVILCGTTHRSEDTINVYALCLQTSALQSLPHKIDGIFYFHDKKWDIKSFICSCKGGNSGRCKHISAVLLSCTRTTLDKLEPLSQTDISCAWSTQKSMTQQKYQPVPIAEMECIKKIVAYDVNNDIFTKIYDNLITSLPNSALSLHKTGRNNVVENEIDIVEYIFEDKSIETKMLLLNHATQSTLMMELAHHQIQFVDSCCQDLYLKKLSKHVCKILSETKQSKAEWLLERKFRITGSRIYEIYTYKGQDWSRKSNRYFDPKGFSNKFTEHGLKYEEIALKVFINTTGLSVVNCGIIVNCNQVPEQLLEIKCPFAVFFSYNSMSDSKEKCRQYNDEYINHGFIASPGNSSLPMCLLCNKTMSNDSIKLSKLKEHLIKIHNNNKDKDLTFFQTIKGKYLKTPT